MLHKLLNFPDCSTSLLLFLRRSEDVDLYYFSSFLISNHVHELCCHNPLLDDVETRKPVGNVGL